MTLIRSDTWICPDCGAAGTFERFATLNARLNPDARESLLAGKLSTQRCAQCQAVTEVEYPLLYNDPGRGIMVYKLGRPEPPTREAFAEHLPPPGQLRIFERLCPYRFRLAVKFGDLVERIRILESGLDERVIERLKMVRGDMQFRVLTEENARLLPSLQAVAMLGAGRGQEKEPPAEIVATGLPRFLGLVESGEDLRFESGFALGLLRGGRPMPLEVIWKREEHDRLAGLLEPHWPLPEPIKEKWLWFDPFESQRLGESAPEPDLGKLHTMLRDPRQFYAEGGADEHPAGGATAPAVGQSCEKPSAVDSGAEAPDKPNSGWLVVLPFLRGVLAIGVMFFLLLAQGYKNMQPGTATAMKALAGVCVALFVGTFFIPRK